MRILIAEDDPTSAIALEGMLTKLGYEVSVAVNGVDALRKWEETGTRILILDWMMPGMDGIEVCTRIRASKPKAYTCIIMLTAKREQDDRVVALRAGVDVFLTKPLNKEELLARLQIAERILAIESEGVKVAA